MTRLDTPHTHARPPTPPIEGANAPMGRGCGRESDSTGEPLYVVTLRPADPIRLRQFLKRVYRGTIQERIAGAADSARLVAVDVREVDSGKDSQPEQDFSRPPTEDQKEGEA